jgi:hypothetical protein
MGCEVEEGADDCSNGGIKKFLNNVTHTLTANRYGGS